MKNTITYKGQVIWVERMESSRNGNPRYRVTIGNPDTSNQVTACTTPDSSYGYSVKNLRDGDSVEMVVGTHYGVQSIDSIKKV